MNNPITTISRERLEEMSQCSDVTTLFAYEMRHMARALLAVMDVRDDRQQCIAWVEEHFSPGFIDTRLAKNGDGTDWMSWDMAAIWKVWHHFATPPVPSAPDGWIKCSDSMPEEGGRYWCYVEEQNCLGKSHYQWNCSWNGDEWSDNALTGRVTHWMPLAAAPGGE